MRCVSELFVDSRWLLEVSGKFPISRNAKVRSEFLEMLLSGYRVGTILQGHENSKKNTAETETYCIIASKDYC